MHDNRLIFDGISTDIFNTYITDAGAYESPKPDYETISIEGRTGDLIVEKGTYPNITVKYPVVIYEDFDQNYMRLRSFLMSRRGYSRLEDTFFPDRYRMGRFTNDVTPKYPAGSPKGTFEIEFDCMPQWFLKSGEHKVTFTQGGTLYNPTMFDALPIIRVYGSGRFSINGNSVTVASGASSYVDIDSEARDSYEGTRNRNNLITRTGSFPTLTAGANTITMTGITRLEITPRWYVL